MSHYIDLSINSRLCILKHKYWRFGSAEELADMDNADDPALLQKNLQDNSGENSSEDLADTCPCLETTVIGGPAGQAEDLVEHIAMEPEDQNFEAPTGKSSKWKMSYQKLKVNKKVGRCLFYL
jgi:hypothetical protein